MLGTKIGIAKVQKNARREVKPNLRCAYFRPRFFVEKFLPDIQPGWLEADGRALGRSWTRLAPDCSLPTHFAHIAKHHMQGTRYNPSVLILVFMLQIFKALFVS